MLSKRLSKVLNLIDINANVADIGCDHGYLAIEAVKRGSKLVQLVDNKKMPLDVARKNFDKIEHDSKVIYTLADGLSKIDEHINVVAICGMGGDLISKIVLDNLDVAKRMNYLVLEPNSREYNLRKTLNDNNFEILEEDIVMEKEKFYVIIKCKYNKNVNKISEKELLYGEKIICKNSDYYKYLCFKLNVINEIMSKMKNESNSDLLTQKQILEGLIHETNSNN